MFKNWGNRDWVWLTCVLVSLLLLSLSIVLSNANQLIQIFSFLSSGVSIALAFVAIYVSSNQNRDSQYLSQDMSQTLVRMDEKVQSINEKVDKFDHTPLIQDTENKINEILENAGSSNEKDLENIREMITGELDKLQIKMDTKLMSRNEIPKRYVPSPNIVQVNLTEGIKKNILNMGEQLKKLKPFEIKQWLKENNKYYTPITIIFDLALDELVEDGLLVKHSDGSYSRL